MKLFLVGYAIYQGNFEAYNNKECSGSLKCAFSLFFYLGEARQQCKQKKSKRLSSGGAVTQRQGRRRWQQGEDKPKSERDGTAAQRIRVGMCIKPGVYESSIRRLDYTCIILDYVL